MTTTAAFEREPLDEALVVAFAVARHAPLARTAAAQMTDLAALRALPGPVITDQRSFAREALEELADTRNYLVWQHRLRAGAGAGHDELATIERAIASLAVTWQHVTAITDHAQKESTP